MRTPASPSPLRGPYPDVLLLLRSAAAVSALLLVWLGWTMLGSADAAQETARQSVAVADLRERIAYLNEHVIMSARMAAVSGDRSWIERFEQAVPALETAITAAASMTPPEALPALSETLIEAHRDLIQMERRALTLAESNWLGAAQALLGSAEFAYLEDVHTGGMEIFVRDIEASVRKRAEASRHQSWVRAFAFGAMAIMLVVTLMAARHRVRLRNAGDIDVLTQLPNRHQLYAALSSRLARLSAPDAPRLTLAIVGIDHFKGINDTFGHAAADKLLQLVTARLREAAGPGMSLARVGGDEFALLFDTAGPPFGADCPSRSVMDALARPYRLNDGSEILLAFSAGAVRAGSQGAEAGDLLRQAGAAFRQAKSDGRGCSRVFDHAMDARARDRVKLGADLRAAIDHDAIVPFFQPLVDLPTGRVVGVEALARWNHAERGWVSPADFIPLAEDLGLIDALMQRLLRRACSEALHWPAEITVAFNVSPLQLRDGALPERIRAILSESGFPAERLEIEVTESALVADLEFARGLLEDLRRSGVRLALDDFGTGYSSLKHLRCLPFDKLKIDASFVGGMVDDGESGKIVAAVIGLGHSLGLSTVAEGVETPQVAAALRELGCDIGQGWLFGRPVPACELAFLAATSRAA